MRARRQGGFLTFAATTMNGGCADGNRLDTGFFGLDDTASNLRQNNTGLADSCPRMSSTFTAMSFREMPKLSGQTVSRLMKLMTALRRAKPLI